MLRANLKPSIVIGCHVRWYIPGGRWSRVTRASYIVSLGYKKLSQQIKKWKDDNHTVIYLTHKHEDLCLMLRTHAKPKQKQKLGLVVWPLILCKKGSQGLASWEPLSKSYSDFHNVYCGMCVLPLLPASYKYTHKLKYLSNSLSYI